MKNITAATILSFSALSLVACGGSKAPEPQAAVAEERAEDAAKKTEANTDRAENAADSAEAGAAKSDKAADGAEKAAADAKK